MNARGQESDDRDQNFVRHACPHSRLRLRRPTHFAICNFPPPPAASRQSSARSAFSLIELLIVISLVGILSSLALTSIAPTVHDQLHSAANVVAAELAYGRSLAVANNSKYRFDFDVAGNRLVLRHSGIDSSLFNLPPSPFRSPTDLASQQTLRLGELPSLGLPVRLFGAQTVAGATATTTFVEFGPYGETTRAETTYLYLAAGAGEARRFIPLSINPITGLTTIGAFTGAAPAGLVGS